MPMKKRVRKKAAPKLAVVGKQKESGPSGWSRAMWVFLGYMLVGPFFAGLAVAGALIIGPLVGMEAWLPDPIPVPGPTAISAYVWAAVPSALAAIVVLPRVIKHGRFGWIEAAAAGVVAYAATSVMTGVPARELLPGLSFVAGLVSVLVQKAMEAGGIIKGAG